MSGKRTTRNARRLLAGDADPTSRAVRADRSTRRVLTTELCDGADFDGFRHHRAQAVRDRRARVHRACFSSLFRHGVYNADPHPGNYRHRRRPRHPARLGCVKQFPRLIAGWKAIARATSTATAPASAAPDRCRLRRLRPPLTSITS
jgi:predicted unusual protein kinase regulating ubiquinone biosynthesis (AarF/ABC1/UbiB family)